ncbi:transglutaminase family protein [Humibacillus xanthopallidus]|uniref:Transglutaminase-like putative cysteine protease n=1 Tax=Humibacillus xanthopallidus TaxID=412689 RepID=A0A543I3N6_9MICO|nr:transglutaminase family protein [Humibacillus xanthopallidus]TQM65198.1 transglutaminase-like putative cysteine protease [Humibacillus xanthopallidus]
MRRFRIVHSTSMAYDQPVRASHNELRMSPVNEPGQTTLDNRVRVKPLTWSLLYRDHWGTQVMALESLSQHSHLDIEATSTVERTPVDPPADSAGWSTVQDPAVRDRTFEWLMLSRRTRPGEGVDSLADSVRGLATPREAAYRLCELLHDEMTYEPGSTAVHSSGEQAWAERRGVCQDFAHIAVGALRSLGIPARYVSGYLAPKRDSEIGETSVGESHAWVEFWDGTWLAADPTNARPVGLEHVVVARGRDYEDVPPLKGVYSGQGVATLDVEVRFTRLA